MNRYTLAKKLAIVCEWMLPGGSLDEICWDYSLSARTVKRWRLEFEQRGYVCSMAQVEHCRNRMRRRRSGRESG